MELHEKIISKNEINARAVEAFLAIIANGLVATKTDLAECLGVTPQKFSEILNYRMKAGVDMIAKICDFYYVNPDWLLMGRGKKIFRDTEREPYFIEDDNNLDRFWHSTQDNDKDNVSVETSQSANDPQLIAKLLEQAEEIGRLKERIAQLEREKGKDVSDAQTSGVANAG